MARTDWTLPHSQLPGLSENGRAQGIELTGIDNPTLHEVLKEAWRSVSPAMSASSFAKSDTAQLLFPGVSARSIDTRIGKVIKPETKAEEKQAEQDDLTINLFEAHNCQLNRTHVAIQKGRTYREPVLVRVSTRKTPPYGRVEVGDMVFLKASGGPMLRKSTVKRVDSFDDASEKTEEIMELIKATELYENEEFREYISAPTPTGKARDYCTVVILEPWEDLEERVIVHPPKGVASSWVTISSDRQIEQYLIGERQLPPKQRRREKILEKYEGKPDGDEV
ncbi:MAG: hypothetical protein ACTSPX_04320 [Candidatus Thorarchaeota archaeon]